MDMLLSMVIAKMKLIAGYKKLDIGWNLNNMNQRMKSVIKLNITVLEDDLNDLDRLSVGNDNVLNKQVSDIREAIKDMRNILNSYEN